MGSVAGLRPHAGGMNKLSVLIDRVRSARRRGGGDRAVGVGTVRAVERQVFIEVVAVSGETFIGKLARCGDDLDISMLRPGLVVLVAFDPAARESLSLPDDVLAVHAAWVASL
ncbi:hypothetical protein A5681_00380 [Mycobacterium scrofulaceum]|uniref:hypothetical protein n=1 Tax=Mycobacterium scrofulaceum TaxID=1783 RepID=UPI0007FF4E28|nr:hypothetical protein A5681_00380 [Mycobacterium scrofulaceum]